MDVQCSNLVQQVLFFLASRQQPVITRADITAIKIGTAAIITKLASKVYDAFQANPRWSQASCRQSSESISPPLAVRCGRLVLVILFLRGAMRREVVQTQPLFTSRCTLATEVFNVVLCVTVLWTRV